MNLKAKLKSYNFWVSLGSAVFLLISLIGKQIGFTIDESAFYDIFTSICGILVILGIITIPAGSTRPENPTVQFQAKEDKEPDTQNSNPDGNLYSDTSTNSTEQPSDAPQDSINQPEAVAEHDSINLQEIVAQPETLAQPKTVAQPEAVAQQETVVQQDATNQPETTVQQEPTNQPETTVQQEPTNQPEANGQHEPTVQQEFVEQQETIAQQTVIDQPASTTIQSNNEQN